MFAILNFAKITDAPMEGEWVMEVDWVKHEYWDGSDDAQDIVPPTNLALIETDGSVSLSWDTVGGDARYNVYRAAQSGKRGKCIAKDLTCLLYTSPSPRDRG